MSKNLLNMTPKELEKQAEERARLLKMALAEVHTPAYKDGKRLMAIDTRERYLSLVEVGFTEAQAVELCKKP